MIATNQLTMLPKPAFDYFTVMCSRWDEVQTNVSRLMHVHELAARFPTAKNMKLEIVSNTHLQLIYTIGETMYRLVGQYADRIIRTTLDEVREVP
jgi:hypothetical protein